MITDESFPGANDDREGLCEAGIFALTPAGWTLLFRQQFTQIGTAKAWAKREREQLRPLELLSHWIIVNAADSKTLDDILALFEATRWIHDEGVASHVADRDRLSQQRWTRQ